MKKKIKVLRKITKFWKRFKKGILGSSAIALILIIHGLYSGSKDVIKDIKDASKANQNYWYCEQDQNIRGIMLSDAYTDVGELSPLDIMTAGTIAKGKVGIKFEYQGSVAFGDYFCFDSDLVWVKNHCSFMYRVSEEGKLLITAEIYNTEKCLVGLVRDNQFIINTDCQFTWNMDDTGFEIVDSEFYPVLSIDYYEPRTLAIQGFFYDVDHYIVYGTRYFGPVKLDDKEGIEFSKRQLNPIFEYFGQNWFGKRKTYN